VDFTVVSAWGFSFFITLSQMTGIGSEASIPTSRKNGEKWGTQRCALRRG
jgi:hypothetical protein